MASCEGDAQRGLAWSDMAVLLRSVRKTAGPITRALDAVGVPYIVVGMATRKEIVQPNAERHAYYSIQRVFLAFLEALELREERVPKRSEFWETILASKYVRRTKRPDYRKRERRPARAKASIVNVVFSFSDLKYFFECPYQFKLRVLYGFNAPLHEALGYGKSLHDALAEVHAHAIRGDVAFTHARLGCMTPPTATPLAYRWLPVSREISPPARSRLRTVSDTPHPSSSDKLPAVLAAGEAAAARPAPHARDDAASPRGAETVFNHLAADNATIYRAILRAFAAARQGFVLHLRPADVSRSLPLDAPPIVEDVLTRSLEQLYGWENLERQPDTAEVQTIEAFYKPRYLYRLTPRGEAAERALAYFSELLEQRGELQVVALSDIRVELHELVRWCDVEAPDAAVASASLERIFSRLESLTVRAQRFLDGLHQGLDGALLGGEELALYKELVVNYLERFVGELLAIGPQIAQLVLDANQRGVERLLALSAERELADALDATAPDHAAAHASWRRRWRGLERWFIGETGQPSQAELLRGEARRAIIGLLSAVQLLHDRRQRRSDRSADLLELAAWFAEAPEEDDCHRLWRSAFGLSPARHLATDHDTVTAHEDRREGAQTSWLDATPVEISPRLRKHGSYQARGRHSALVDRSAEKAALLLLRRSERTQLEAARQALCANGETTLSALGTLERSSFDLLLDLLGAAVARGTRGNEPLIATSSDGALRIVLRPLPNGAEARIETRDGTLRCRDYAVQIVPTYAAPQPEVVP